MRHGQMNARSGKPMDEPVGRHQTKKSASGAASNVTINTYAPYWFDTPTAQCYYSATMNTGHLFTYSYLGGGYAPSPAH